MKFATIERGIGIKQIGRLTAPEQAEVQRRVQAFFH
jgi:hypothetical protein